MDTTAVLGLDDPDRRYQNVMDAILKDVFPDSNSPEAAARAAFERINRLTKTGLPSDPATIDVFESRKIIELAARLYFEIRYKEGKA